MFVKYWRNETGGVNTSITTYNFRGHSHSLSISMSKQPTISLFFFFFFPLAIELLDHLFPLFASLTLPHSICNPLVIFVSLFISASQPITLTYLQWISLLFYFYSKFILLYFVQPLGFFFHSINSQVISQVLRRKIRVIISDTSNHKFIITAVRWTICIISCVPLTERRRLIVNLDDEFLYCEYL